MLFVQTQSVCLQSRCSSGPNPRRESKYIPALILGRAVPTGNLQVGADDPERTGVLLDPETQRSSVALLTQGAHGRLRAIRPPRTDHMSMCGIQMSPLQLRARVGLMSCFHRLSLIRAPQSGALEAAPDTKPIKSV